MCPLPTNKLFDVACPLARWSLGRFQLSRFLLNRPSSLCSNDVLVM